MREEQNHAKGPKLHKGDGSINDSQLAKMKKYIPDVSLP